eukprot:1942023-Prymnesium_polylepis.1
MLSKWRYGRMIHHSRTPHLHCKINWYMYRFRTVKSKLATERGTRFHTVAGGDVKGALIRTASRIT